MNFVNRTVTVVLAAVILLLCFTFSIFAEDGLKSIDSGYVNVKDFGANGLDSKDDTEAFEAALATGKNIYVPIGNFYVSKTLKINDRIIRGSEPGKTKIYGKIEDKNAPIMLLEGISSVYDMRIGYKTKEECLGVKNGEKVVIQLGSQERGLEPGSVIKSLFIIYSGTSIYNPKEAKCDGAIIDNIQAYPLYRGIDMQGENRIGNSFSNLYLSTIDTENAITIDCGFALEGSGYGETVHQLNVEHNTYSSACAILKNSKNFNISTIHFEGVNLANNDSGWLYLENSTGYIGVYTTYYPYINSYKNSMIRFGDSDGINRLVIGEIHNRGLNAPDTSAHSDWIAEMEERKVSKGMNKGGETAADFRILRRAKDAAGKYEVIGDFYSYYSFHEGDTDYYLNFMDKDDDINFQLKHEAREAADGEK